MITWLGRSPARARLNLTVGPFLNRRDVNERTFGYLVAVIVFAGLPMMFGGLLLGRGLGAGLLFAGMASVPILFTLLAFRSQNPWYQARRRWAYLALGSVAIGYSSLVAEISANVTSLSFYSMMMYLGGNIMLTELSRRASNHPSKGGEVSLNAIETKGFALTNFQLTEDGIVKTRVSTFISPLILALLVIPAGVLFGLGLGSVITLIVFSVVVGIVLTLFTLSIRRRRMRLSRLPPEQLKALKDSVMIPWSAVSSARLKGLILMMTFDGQEHRATIGASSSETVGEFPKYKLGHKFGAA